MTAIARANGWHGFDSIGEKVPGGTRYLCDGMPHLMGCSQETTIRRPWSKVGIKGLGWLVMYGSCFPDERADDDAGNDFDVVLVFCPSCAAVVREQQAATNTPEHSAGDALGIGGSDLPSTGRASP
jgi:hypothetical protein